MSYLEVFQDFLKELRSKSIRPQVGHSSIDILFCEKGFQSHCLLNGNQALVNKVWDESQTEFLNTKFLIKVQEFCLYVFVKNVDPNLARISTNDVFPSLCCLDSMEIRRGFITFS